MVARNSVNRLSMKSRVPVELPVGCFVCIVAAGGGRQSHEGYVQRDSSLKQGYTER